MTSAFYASYVALWLVVSFQTLVLLGLVKSHGHGELVSPHEHFHPVSNLTGQSVPTFAAMTLSGDVFDDAALVGDDTALLFVSPECKSCTATLDELRALQGRTGGRIVLVCRGVSMECQKLAKTFDLNLTVVVDDDGGLTELFGVNGTPTAVMINPNGVVASYGHPMRGADLERLFPAYLAN